METIDLRFKYTQAEYVKAERQNLFATKAITKASVIIFPICVLLTIWYLFFSEFSTLSIIALVAAVFALMANGILYFYIPVYKFKHTSKYHEEYQLIFSKKDIKFRTPTINSELKWNVYTEIWESAEFFFLVQTPRMYALIPKRAFPDSATQQAFEKMALSQLKCTKRMVGK